MTELRQTLRSLAQAPVFTVVAILTLAAGIGLNTSMASLLEALLLRPAPFADASRLFKIEGLAPDGTEAGLSVPEIDAIEAGLAGDATPVSFRWIDVALTEPGAPAENFVAVATTGGFFPGLGVPAALGRTYGPADLASPDTPVAVLGHEMWQRRFGGDPDIVGRTVRLNGRAVTVLGVMPPAFSYRLLWIYGDLWVPGTFRQDARTSYESRQHALVVRLRDGITPAELRTRVAALGARFAADHPQTNARRAFRATPLHESTVAPTFRRLSYLIAGVSAAVLLIVCANLASLQLARALGRRHEQAVRAALGASPGHLLRRQLGESLLLGLAGGVLGLLLAFWVNDLLSARLVVGLAGRLDLQINLPVLALSSGLALLASLAAGAAPALLAARADVNDALKGQSRGSTATRSQQRLRQALIVGEIALALTLLTGAGILVHSVGRYLERPVGWNTDNITFGTIALPRARYESRDVRRVFHQKLEQQLLTQPGVSQAALTSLPPLVTYWTTRNYRPEDRAGGDPVSAFYVPSSPSYLETIGLPLIEGRGISPAIGAGDPPVAVINESLARALWPGQSAVGRRLLDARGTAAIEIIGVVRDAGFPANIDAPATPYQVYQPFIQDPWPYITIALRGPGGSQELTAAMRRAVAQLDPDVPVQDISDVSTAITRQQGNLQLLMRALTLFAFTGLALAVVGVYGVIAHGAAQRRTEFGIRLALGASPGDVTSLVVGQGGRLAALGTVAGLAGSFAFAWALEAALPQVTEPALFLFPAVAAVMAGVTLLASWLPARRAARVDPLVALRNE